MQQSFQLVDYEHLYRSKEQRDRDGHRPLISNNFGNLTTIRAIEDLVLHHPLFGNFILFLLYPKNELFTYVSGEEMAIIIKTIHFRIKKSRFPTISQKWLRVLLYVYCQSYTVFSTKRSEPYSSKVKWCCHGRLQL